MNHIQQNNIQKSRLNPSVISAQHPSDNIKEYLNIIRNNLLPIVLIFLASFIATIIYITNAIDIYKTTTSIKINKLQGNILTTQFGQYDNFEADRFISNEIEIMKSSVIREKAAMFLIDSFKVNPDKSNYYYLVNRTTGELVSYQYMTAILSGIISISQRRGLDFVEISAESPSRYEAKLIADVYAIAYLQYSIDYSKREVTTIRKFLEDEKQKRANELAISEVALQDYQQRGGIMFLNEQASGLVTRISDLEAQKNSAEIDYISQMKVYSEIKTEVSKLDADILTFFDGKMNENYVSELQKKIAELEVQKELEYTIPADEKLKSKVATTYDKKIEPLRKSLDDKIEILKKALYANTPDERRMYLQKLFESNILVLSTKARLNSLSKFLGKYESEFSRLPAKSIELARLERARKSNEKLFTTLEEKYQEALVNENSQVGNVNIVDKAYMPGNPSKPNRRMIVLAGSILGLALGIGFAFLRNYLDRSIKTPEDIENKGVSVLAWIPSIEELKELGSSQLEFIIANKPKSNASESFKALRTRVLFSKLETEPIRTILITSSIPAEGKTTVALNLAGSFAQSDKKTLLLDCDLRKPRIHAIFESERFPGMSDYLFANASIEDVIRKTKLSNLDYITSGTIPPNPSELLGSSQMTNFIEKMKESYEMIVIDSPPYISVTDSEILSRITDGTILVVQANKTPIDAFLRTYERINNIGEHKFLGAVLNNFMYKQAYGYYYNYYYYYSRPDGEKTKKRV